MKKARKMITLAAGFVLALSLASGAAIAASPKKDIRVEARKDKIALNVKPGKKAYAVDEPISFKVKVNKPAYIYVFNVSEDGENITMIFPNQFDTNNMVKPTKKPVVIPANSDFKSDSEGVENIVVVASAKELQLEATPQENSKFLNVKKGTFDKTLKDIRVEKHEDKDDLGTIKELQVTIKGN